MDDLQSLFSSALTPEERKRLKDLATSAQRGNKLAAVALMGTDEGLNRLGVHLGRTAADDRTESIRGFESERDYNASLAQTLQRSADREEDRAQRRAEQEALADYRRQNLAQQDQRIGIARDAASRAGGLTAYQQAKMDEADRARQAAADAKLNAGVTKYGNEIANRAGITSAIADVDLLLDPYRKSGGNIPGVGGLANKEGWIGNVAAKLEGGSTIRQKVATVRNQILKARSGGAVTPQEADRLLTEFGQVATATDADFLSAWDSFVKNNRAELAGLDAAYGADVVNEFQRRTKQRDSAVEAARQSGRNRGSY